MTLFIDTTSLDAVSLTATLTCDRTSGALASVDSG